MASSLPKERSWSLKAEALKMSWLLKLRSRRVKVGAMLWSLSWEEASPSSSYVSGAKVKGS